MLKANQSGDCQHVRRRFVSLELLALGKRFGRAMVGCSPEEWADGTIGYSLTLGDGSPAERIAPEFPQRTDLRGTHRVSWRRRLGVDAGAIRAVSTYPERSSETASMTACKQAAPKLPFGCSPQREFAAASSRMVIEVCSPGCTSTGSLAFWQSTT